MKAFFRLGQYDQWVEIGEGEVKNFSCLCPDFTFRKLKEWQETGELKPCKHLIQIINMLDKQFMQTIRRIE